ncbi:MAG: NAD-binding protein, partial [Selenomonadaceae bacterium]|nr:NAD-binding protein [Selenomonadaceae bacterium]
MSNGKPRIVIVGGGFGGIKIGQLFAKENVDVTIIDRHNFH